MFFILYLLLSLIIHRLNFEIACHFIQKVIFISKIEKGVKCKKKFKKKEFLTLHLRF